MDTKTKIAIADAYATSEANRLCGRDTMFSPTWDHAYLQAHEFKLAQLEQSNKEIKQHILYTNKDNNIPNRITDQHGDVVLSMCKKCGKVETDLDQSCVTIQELSTDLTNYIREKHTQEECIGFIDGYKSAEKKLKSFNTDLFKAYINKFSEEDKLKALKTLVLNINTTNRTLNEILNELCRVL